MSESESEHEERSARTVPISHDTYPSAESVQENMADSNLESRSEKAKKPRKQRKPSVDSRLSGLESSIKAISELLAGSLAPRQRPENTDEIVVPRFPIPRALSPDVNIISMGEHVTPTGVDEIEREDCVSELSLQPGQRELGEILSDQESNSSIVEGQNEHSAGSKTNKNYENILLDKDSGLKELFKDNVAKLQTHGLVLDEVQVESLNKNWRTANPDKLSAYKDECASVFPVHQSAKDMLQVPSLDDILEPMLRNKHGSRAVKGWSKGRTLYTQPLKMIETLGYQGHLASRFNVISSAYIQQALGTLLKVLKKKDTNVDLAIQMTKDIYAMSTKNLEQGGKAGAYLHMVRRKAAMSDSGLQELTDVQGKALYLPLTHEGVFGSGLTDHLKTRKEQKDQLKDLIPELSQNKYSNKRKSDSVYSDNKFKKPRFQEQKTSTKNYSNNNSYRKSNVSSTYTPTANNNNYRNQSYNYKKDSNKGLSSGFRIPKKQ